MGFCISIHSYEVIFTCVLRQTQTISFTRRTHYKLLIVQTFACDKNNNYLNNFYYPLVRRKDRIQSIIQKQDSLHSYSHCIVFDSSLAHSLCIEENLVLDHQLHNLRIMKDRESRSLQLRSFLVGILQHRIRFALRKTYFDQCSDSRIHRERNLQGKMDQILSLIHSFWKCRFQGLDDQIQFSKLIHIYLLTSESTSESYWGKL